VFSRQQVDGQNGERKLTLCGYKGAVGRVFVGCVRVQKRPLNAGGLSQRDNRHLVYFFGVVCLASAMTAAKAGLG